MVPKDLESVCYVVEHYHIADAGMSLMLRSLIEGIQKFFPRSFVVLMYSSVKYQEWRTGSDNVEEPYVYKTLVTLELRRQPLHCILHQIRAAAEKEQSGFVIDMPTLGYTFKKYHNLQEFLDAAETRKTLKLQYLKPLLELKGFMVHHTHNPTLMKNPLETYANYLIAKDLICEPYIQIRHICDLTEDTPAREDLRRLQKRVAGQQAEEFFGHNGSGIAWQTAPNIVYITGNTEDRQALRKSFSEMNDGRTVFYCPCPVDDEELTTAPKWNRNGKTLDDLLVKYCESNKHIGYNFDADAKFLIVTEVARERKNTGEQLLILRMLNHMSCETKLKYQLAITMLPTAAKDLERIVIFQSCIKSNNLPVIMGFGKKLLGQGRTLDDDQFHIRDLWNHPRAVALLTTSTAEGFGLNFVNPAVATLNSKNNNGLATVGRYLPKMFPDLEALGLLMPDDAYYREIMVDQELVMTDYEKYIHKHGDDFVLNVAELVRKKGLNDKFEAIDFGVIEQNQEGLMLGKDFATYSALEQVILMEIIDYGILSKRMQKFISYLQNRKLMNRVAKRNAMAALKRLSTSKYVTEVENIVKEAFKLRTDRIEAGEMPKMIKDNRKLRQICLTRMSQ